MFAILAAAGLVVSRWHKAGPVQSETATLVAAQPAETGQSLTAKIDTVLDAARKAGRKDAELTALTDAKTKLAGLVTSKAPVPELTKAVADMAKTETDLLGRAEKRLWRDVETAPTDVLTGQDVVTKLQQSKNDLDSKLAATPPQDAGQILDGLRLSLMSFGAFQDAYAAATPVYVAARRKSFDTLHSATQTLCDQIVTLGNVEKPWFLASSARKAAYKLRQDNATQAKSLATRLNDLSKTAASSGDLHQLTAAVTEAIAAKKTAGGLYAASNAAQL